MKFNKTIISLLLLATVLTYITGCVQPQEATSDSIQQSQQETILAEASAATGMPAIKNFRERKLLKDIIEMRDQDGLATFTYLETLDGKLVFLCNSFGYGIPASTQYTNPEKVIEYQSTTLSSYHVLIIPQADPNGLFSPASAEGTWVMCTDPNDASMNSTKPVYIEPRVIVSPFSLMKEKE